MGNGQAVVQSSLPDTNIERSILKWLLPLESSHLPGVHCAGGGQRAGVVARLAGTVARRWRGDSSQCCCPQSVLLLLALLHLLRGGHGSHGEHVGVAREGSGSCQCQLRCHPHDTRAAVLRRDVAASWEGSVSCRSFSSPSIVGRLGVASGYWDITWTMSPLEYAELVGQSIDKVFSFQKVQTDRQTKTSRVNI